MRLGRELRDGGYFYVATRVPANRIHCPRQRNPDVLNRRGTMPIWSDWGFGMLVNQERPDRDVLNLVIIPGFFLIILYLLFDISATVAMGWIWKFGYAIDLFFVISYLIRRLLLKWRLSRAERVKLVEGFFAGAFTSFIGIGAMSPIDPIWIAVSALVFGFSFGYFFGGLWFPPSPKGLAL